MARRAYTLIELLIVMAISAVLSAFAITYSHSSQKVIALSVEASKVSQFILQAKELSIATYTSAAGASKSCGYGIAFNTAQQTYSIFAYAPNGSPPCPSLATVISGLSGSGIAGSEEQEYTEGTWQVPLTKGVVLKSQSDSLAAAVFYPPAPTVFLSHDGTVFPNPAASLNVHLATTDGSESVTISVNPEGQVNF